MGFREWILAHGEDLQFVVFFAVLPAMLLAERLAPRRPAPADRKRRWRTNAGLTLLNVVTLSLQPLSLIGAARWAEVHGWGLLNLGALPVALLVAGTLLARAFISYATHWMMHRVPFCWRLHRVHHLDTELDVSSTVRFHPIEFLITTVPAVPMVIGFGLTPWVLAIYELLDVGVTLFSHSNLRLPAALDAVLRRVIVTPDLHRVHHSTWQPETDSNFGAVFPWWDLIFRTYRAAPRDPHATMRLGLDAQRGPDAHGLWWLLRSIAWRTLPGDGAPAADGT
jgi:sterol desaturase/sphingolipid hydroxylase (fatty acid hydroxylase superfamily)